MTATKRTNGFVQWLKESLGLRIFVLGILALILLIPLEFVKNLFHERERLQRDSIDEVSQKWGSEQVLLGPILNIPYLEEVKVYTEDGKNFKWETQKKNFFILPDELNIVAEIDTEVRYRGVYEIIVYKTKIQLEGRFEDYGAKEVWKKWGIRADQIQWDEVTAELSVGDPKGINSEIAMGWNEETVHFAKGESESNLHFLANSHYDSYDYNNTITNSNYMSSRVPMSLKSGLPTENRFKIDFDLNGSKKLHFVPIGKTTTASLTSSWPSPSFDGEFSPKTRTVDASGFSAFWNVIHLNRSFPQQMLNSQSIKNISFGLTLYKPGNIYQMTDRAGKYGFMIIALTLLAFFFFQLFYPIRVHSFQLFLIGLALCVFYALLIAISERILFSNSYLISSGATIVLIVTFTWGIVKRIRIALQLGVLLVLLYGAIFWLIQLEDPLLAGTLTLFGILAVLMALSSKIDWFKNTTNSKS